MADNVGTTTGTSATIAADDVSGVMHQRVKISVGADGVATDMSVDSPLSADIVHAGAYVTTGNPIPAEIWINNNVLSAAQPIPIKYGLGPSIDAFGRARVSNPETIFASKQILDNQPLFWDDSQESGASTTSTHDADKAATTMGVALNTAGKRTRQTFMRFNYQPGKSQLFLLTARMSNSSTGIVGRVGAFDDNNGMFFANDEGTIKVVCRSNVTGTAVDTEVASTAWNGDKMDGTGASGQTLDVTKTQIMWFDMEWLGVGDVRMGFVVDGAFILAHTFHNTNTIATVYMSTPNLPLRYQIENDGTGAATDMDHICSTVISEGGTQDLGVLRWESTEGTHIDANTADTVYTIAAIRLKTTHLDSTITIKDVSMVNATTDDFEWIVLLNPTVANAVTFSNVTNSAIQFATGNSGNPSNSTLTGGTKVGGGFVKSGGGSGSFSATLNNAIRLGAAIDGTRDEIYLGCRPLSSNADIDGGIGWRETP